MKSKNILFRADSSSTIGTGHIMRDLVLAKQYENNNITFAVQKLNGNINYKIEEAGYRRYILESNSVEELDYVIKKLNIDLIVIDHYGINGSIEKKLKENNKNLKILSFDDTYEKHYCDILLNHNINAEAKRYKKLVPKNCEIRCGKEYTLLRDEFYRQKKKKKKPNKDNKRIFIAMGGVDHSNLNIKILKVINKWVKQNKKSKNFFDIILVTTDANKNLNALKEYCKNKKGINLYVNSNEIAKLMRKSDLAIITPSVILNEVFFMELPFIAIQTTYNQKDVYKYLKQKKFLAMKKFNRNKLTKFINKWVN